MDAGSTDSGVQNTDSMSTRAESSVSTLVEPRPGQGRPSLDSGVRSGHSTTRGHSALPGLASAAMGGAERTKEWIRTSNFEVQVQDLEGNKFTVETNSEEKVEVFRKKVAQRTGTAVNNITTKEGKTLENGTKMGYNGIKRGQLLYCSHLSVGG
ncbi:uncharacterized protein LOC131934938 [Physella acuta]|uniref:uncharacterized protein LOC131934938 n=1 Tax=Physella acuta TaxID=109671 RepID=UPI0027DD2C1D|nr:uncharacterized protein LOC131934938 [Physella acuta]